MSCWAILALTFRASFVSSSLKSGQEGSGQDKEADVHPPVPGGLGPDSSPCELTVSGHVSAGWSSGVAVLIDEGLEQEVGVSQGL